MIDPALTRWLSRRQAADYLGVSLRTFDRHVAPFVPRASVGTLARFDREDLDRWLENQKAGSYSETRAPVSGPSASRSRTDNAAIARQERAIREKLKEKLQSSSRKLFLVDGELTRKK